MIFEYVCFRYKQYVYESHMVAVIDKTIYFICAVLIVVAMEATDTQIKKALVAFAIEKVLIEMGEPVFNKVAKALKDDYNCYIPDCYDHPEYLKRVLSDLYGDAHTAIINSIKNNLLEFSQQESISKFISVLE